MSETTVLTAQFDTPWKAALERFFEQFVAFCFPQLHALIDWTVPPRFLDTETQALRLQADLLNAQLRNQLGDTR